jgi:hypothetical protein
MTTYTISQWEADVLASTWVSGSTIEDTAFNISAAGVLDALQAAYTTIGEIIVSDNQPIGVDVAQITSDANALALLHNANSTAYTLTVTDIGSNISGTALDTLNSDTHVTKIVVSSGTVDVSVAQLASDATALSFLKTTLGAQASVTVDDTGAHIHSGWANIAADSQVSSVVISDNTQVNLTATQASQTATVGELVQADSNTNDIVLVKDTAAHIEADLTALNSVASYIDTVTVSNNTFETLSATQVAADLSILSKVVFSSGPASFNVSDTATAISGNLDALESLSGSISSITVTTNSPVTVSIEQLAADSDALSIMTYSNSDPITVAVLDTGDNISGNLATLEAAIQAASPAITSISVSGSEAINVTISQFTTDAGVFAALTGTYTLDVSDTAHDISGALGMLETLAANGNISAINVTDSGAIAVNVAQITSDASALAELVNNDTNPYTLAVTDSASSVAAGLVGLSGDSHVETITLTDATPVLTITQTQFFNGLTALGEITNGSFAIDVTGVGASQAANVATDFTGLSNAGDATLSIAVSDAAAAISNYLGSLGTNSYVATISINNATALTLSESHYTNANYDAGLAKMIGTYTVDVTGVSVANLPAVEAVSGLGGTPTVSIAVSDTGSAISGDLSSLGSDTKVTSIAVSSGVLSLTESQFTGDTAGLAKLTGTYTVDVTGVSYAQVATVEAISLPGTPTLSIAVSDTGGDLTSAALVALGGDGNVTSIAVSSGAISLTESQFVGDTAGLGKLTGTYTVDVTGVSYAQVATVEGISLPGTPTLSIAVSDTGGDLTSAALVALGGDSNVTSIAVTSGAISLTEAQFVASGDDLGLAKLTGSYTVDVTGVSYLQVATVEGISLPGTPTLSIAVSDTGGDLTSAALVALGGDSNVTSIAVSSGAISLTESQFVGDTAGLGKLIGSYAVDVTGVSYAQVATVEAISLPGTPTLSIAVSDTGGDLTSAALVALGSDTKVTSIAVTSGAISLTESQFVALGDDAGLAKLTGSYTVDVTGVSYAQVPTVEGISLSGTPTLSIAVSDTGGDLTSAALVALGGDSKVTSISVTSGAISLTESQFTGDTAGLDKLTGSYTVDVTGVSYSQVATVDGVSLPGTPTLSIAVSDTGGHLTAPALVSLGANSKVTSIAVTSGVISLTATQFTTAGEDAGLAKMTGTYTVDVTSVGVAKVAAVEAVTLGGTPTLSISVSDIGSRFTSAELVILGADHKVTSITVTSGAISLTEAQFVASGDDLGLAKLTGTYTVDVTGVSYAQVSTVEGISLPGTPTLSIAVTDTGGDLTSAALVALGGDSKVTSIAVSSGAISLTEAQFVADGAGLGKLIGSYTVDVTGVSYLQVATVEGTSLPGTPTLSIAVSDTGGDLTSAALVALGGDPKVSSIAVTSGAISLTEAQFVGDTAGLGKLTGAYTVDVTGVSYAQVPTVEAISLPGTPTLSIAVSDTGGDLTSAALVALGADSKVTSIAVSSGAISLTESQFVGDTAGLGKLTGSYTVDVTGVSYAQVSTVEAISLPGTPTLSIAVSDTGGDLTNAALVALGGDSKVTSIAVSSGAISLTESQFVGDTAGLGKLTGAYTVDVTGVSYLQVSTVEGISLPGTPTLSIAVSDTGGDLTSAALVALGSDSKVTSIAVSSGAISLTESQFVGDTAGLDKLTGAYTVDVTGVSYAQVSTVEAISLPGTPTLSIAVSDTGGDLTSAALVALGGDSKVTSIAVSSGAISLTESQFTGDTAGLGKLTGSYTVDVTGVSYAQVSTVEGVSLPGTPTLSIAVSDTGGDLTNAALVALGGDSKVTSIAVTSGAISLTESQFVGDTAGLSKLTGSYTVDVTGVSYAQVATVDGVSLPGTPTLSIAVSDTGGDLTAAALVSLGANSKVTSIGVTSGAISLTTSQFLASGEHAGLAKLTGSYTVDVINVGVSMVSTVEAVSLPGTPTLSISVADIGSRFTSTELATLGADPKVTSITVTSGAITLTEAQFTRASDDAGLDKITGSYTVDVTGVTVAQVSTVEGISLPGTPTLSIAVSDTGGNLTSAALVALGGDSKVTSIAVSSGAISLTESQFVGDTAGLGKLIGSYTVDVTGVSYAQVATVEAISLPGTPTLSIAVSDTGGDLTSAALVALGGDSKVTSIAVSSGAISLTESQFVGDTAGLGKLTGAYTVDVTGVSYLQVSTVEGISLPGTPTLSIAVSDTGGDFTSAALVALGSDSKVASIAVSSGAISLTESQFTASGDDAGLAKLTGSYTVDVTGVSYAQVATVEAISLPGTPTLSIAVSDTGGDLTSAALVALGGDSKVTSIAVSSGAISLTESQFVGDTAGLGKLTGAYTVDVTGVSYAQVATVEGISLPGTPTLSIAVSDTGGDLTSAALVALGGDSNVTSIAVTSGAISLTEAQFVASGDDLGLAKLTGSYTVDVTGVSYLQVATVEGISLPGTPTLSIAVSDTGGDLTSAALVALGGDSNVTSIAVSSGAISLTESQFVALGDDAGLAKLTGSYTIDVSGVSAAQVQTVEGISLPGTPTLSIAVNDTGGDLTSVVLVSLGANTSVTSIAVSSGPISLTEAQFTNSSDDLGLAKLTGSYTVDVTGVSYLQVATVEGISLPGTPTLSIAVSDTGGDLTSTALVALGGDDNVTSISVTSGAISLSEAHFVADTAGLGKLIGTYTVDVTGVSVTEIPTVEAVSLPGTPTLSIAVRDIGTAISGDFSSLGSDSDVTSIAISSGVLALTESQYSNSGDVAALAKMTGSYTVDVTGVTYAEVSTVEGATYGGTPTLSIAVSDTGGDLTSAALVSLGSDNDISTIAVTSGVITLTEAQFTTAGDDSGLDKLTGSYTVDVTGVMVGKVATVEGISLPGTPTLSIAVSDAGAAVSGALSTLGSDPDVTSIAVSSGVISLTEANYTNSGYDAGLAKMIGTYTVDVTGVSVTEISTVEAVSLPGTPTLSIAVSDIGTAISGDLSSLGSDSDVTSIAISSGVLALTESQYSNSGDVAALAKMTGSYTVDVTGVSYAQVSTVEGATYGGTPTLSIAVSDTGGDLTSAALVSLGSDNDISTIAVTSGVITLTEAQFTTAGDDSGLDKLTGSYTVDVTDVSVGKVATVEGISLPGTPTLSIAVSDAGAAVSGALSTLGSDPDVTSIAVSSGVISLTEANYTNSGYDAGLAKMIGTYTVDVTGVSVTEISTVEAVSLPGTPTLSIAVSDIGTAISGDLSSLGSDSDVTSIAISSGVLALTESQYSNSGDVAALAKMTGSYTVDVTGVTYAEVSTVEGATYGGTPTLSIAVSDTGGDLTSAALVSLGSDNDISTIAVTSGAITLTDAQLTASGVDTGLEKITGSFAVDVTGATAAQAALLPGDFASLTNAANGTLSIAVSDTAAHVVADAPALNTNPDVTSVTVTDTTAHVQADLDILNGIAALTAITLTDATPVLSLTESQFVGGVLALAEITNASFAINVTGATAAQAATVATDFTGITFIGTPTLTIAVADNASDVAGDEAALNANSYVTSVAVTDTAANVAANLDTLNAVSALTSIKVEGTDPTLSLTAAQFEGGTTALGDITNSTFTIDVTSATAAQAATVATEFGGLGNEAHATLSIAVSDTALDISNAMTVLEANAYVTSLTISDSNALNIDYAQFNAGTTLLSELTGTATVNVSGVTGQAYGSFTDTYIGGTIAETVENNTNNSTSVIGYANDLTFAPAGPSSHVESITTTGTHGDTFVFTGSFGNVTVTGFSLANDFIEFSHTEFANVAAVELHATQVNGNAVVTLDSGDTITFSGVSLASFEAHATDWSFI